MVMATVEYDPPRILHPNLREQVVKYSAVVSRSMLYTAEDDQ